MDLGLGKLLEWQRTDHVRPVGEVFGLPIVLLTGQIVASFSPGRGLQLHHANVSALTCSPPTGIGCTPGLPTGANALIWPLTDQARLSLG